VCEQGRSGRFHRGFTARPAGESCQNAHADQLVEVIEKVAAVRGTSEHLRMSNGPEMIAWALRGWCRLSGTCRTYIEPGASWENPSSNPTLPQ